MQKMQFIQQQRSSGLGGMMSGRPASQPMGGQQLNAGMQFGKPE